MYHKWKRCAEQLSCYYKDSGNKTMVPDSMSALLMRKLPYQGDFFCCFLQIFTFSTHGRAGRIRRIDSKESPRKALKAQCSKTSFSHKFTSVLKTDTIIYGFGSYHFRSCKIFSWKKDTPVCLWTRKSPQQGQLGLNPGSAAGSEPRFCCSVVVLKTLAAHQPGCAWVSSPH